MRSETAIRLLETVRDTYDEIADQFDRTRQKVWSDFDFFTEFLLENPRILDVGCGNGRLLKYFEDKSFETYLGIDNSKELLSHARKQHRDEGVDFKMGDILNLKVDPEMHDVVFSIAVLHHIPSRDLQLKAVSELGRMVTPGGMICVSVWNLHRWRSFSYFLKAFSRSLKTLGDYSFRDLMIPWGKKNPKMRYAHAFTPGELRKLFKEAGLEILSFKTTKQGRFGNHLIVARPFLASREVNIMGVNFHAVNLDETEDVVARLLRSDDQHLLVTPNPEIVLKAQKDEAYRQVLNSASLNLPDGIGILWASTLINVKSRFFRVLRGFWGFFLILFVPSRLHRVLPERVTGTDLMQRLTHSSHKIGAKVFLLGAAPGVGETVAKKWRFDQIVGTYPGSPSSKDESDIIQRVNESGANLLFVAYGAPKQEEWLNRNLKKMPKVKVAVGVGGAFDFFAGLRHRAPEWMQRFGLEWLWRLGQEPRRIKRILDATVRFPLK
ncbi:MAG: WecB/TagA/CpsF family glycosyltransferase, partial [Candidatus Peregrinibacteria bacterium]|nr:WecB/TagA/CpsF family glycosyltransferase [Candidatus Peregrinibacteria bacterium]